MKRPLEEWAGHLYNCFEEVVFPKVPEIRQIKEFLLRAGAVNALMSGSGSALYALVRSKSEGDRVQNKLKGLNLKSWVVHSI